jgi:hypothetical protein
MPSLPIERAELARSGPTSAPRDIAMTQVVEHAMRHLAWLASDDQVVASVLSDRWRALLAAYPVEPFRALG